MELVIDTNCLFSALISKGKSRELICSFKHKLYAPENIITEILNHEKEIIKKAGISKQEFELSMSILSSNIEIVPIEEFASFIDKAKELVAHEEDSSFIALAMHKQLPVWSDDARLKEQEEVKVYSTTELIKKLNL